MSATAPFDTDAAPAQTYARRRTFTWPTWRQAWFQLHWLVGITAGTVLMVIGLSGATLAFREELLDAINPGVRHVVRRAGAVLSPSQLVQAVGVARPGERVAQLTLIAEPGAAARAVLAPPFGQRRGETLYLDPYDGTLRPTLRGGDFFEWVESLHRWLLLPREDGRIVAGTLSICLLGMALSGLYLRWPRRVLDWRTWLAVDTRLTGRAFLWSLHSVIGTWALVLYLVSTSTGIYWAFDTVRSTVDGWLAVDRTGRAASATPPAAKGARKAKAGGDETGAAPIDIAPSWAVFQQRAGAWTFASLRLPQRAAQPLDISWLAPDAPHERARSRMLIAAGGDVTQDDRYADGSRGARLQSTIYPLHMGSYFGLPGRIAMTVGALMLPVFAVTGWLLYLKRRRSAREARLARTALLNTLPTVTSSTVPVNTSDSAPWLIAYASQTGHAERLAWRTAAALTEAGVPVRVESVAVLDPATLSHHGRALLIASSFGDGAPPDSAQRFARRLHALNPDDRPLHDLRFGLLALGDRRHADFCGFGHALDDALSARGASELFPLIEVDDGETDATALARWSAALGTVAGATLVATSPDPVSQAAIWTLTRRQHLNPGSQGGPLFELALTADRAVDWQPGALVDIVPRHPPRAVDDWLRTHRLDGDAMVTHGVTSLPLAALMARSEWPSNASVASPQALADTLVALTARSYSVASVIGDGVVELLVRQERHADGLGIASGWLTAHAQVGSEIELRLVPNPTFAPLPDGRPCIYIGNGSGLAGLRSHLRARVNAGRRANWLLFGERQSAHDKPCRDEIAHWHAIGFLERVDLVFSRDPPGRTYVQDRLREAADELAAWIDRGACIFVCGSLHGMSAGVDAALRDVLGTEGLDDLIAAGRYRRDVY